MGSRGLSKDDTASVHYQENTVQEYFCKQRTIINIYIYVYEIRDLLFIKKIENGGKKERGHPGALLLLVNE